MADKLKERIEILQMAEAQGKTLKPEHQKELEAYRAQGLAKGGEGAGKPVPVSWGKPYEDKIGIYGGLATATKTFQDDYAGNTVTGGLENSVQSRFSGFGTPGQRDWWAQFRSNDNLIRNQLFGAALTDTEKAAYQATTVDESMDPKEVRLNLEKRQEIVRKALSRKTAFLRAQGYDSDAIDALAGEYAADFAAPSQIGQEEIESDVRRLLATGEDPQKIAAYINASGRPVSPDLVAALVANKGYQKPDVRTEVREEAPIGTDAQAALIGAGDAITLGGLDEIAAGLGAVLPIGRDNIWNGRGLKEAYDLNLQQTQGYKNELAGDRPVPSTLGFAAGAVASGAGAARAFPAATSFLTTGGRAARVAKQSAFASGLGGLYGYGSENNDRETGAAIGAITAPIGNALGQGTAKAAGRVLSPVVDKAVKKLTGAGVTLTPGQLLGGVAKRMEDWASGFPLVGDTIVSSRRAVEAQLNRAAVDEALAPIGKTLPADIQPGHAAMAWAEEALSEAYGEALDGLSAQVDQPFAQGLTAVARAAGKLPTAQRELFDTIFSRDVKPFIPANGVFSGAQVQAIKKGLDAQVASLRKGSPADHLLADTLQDARAEFMDLIVRRAPKEAEAFRAADKAFRNFVPVQRAAANAREGGIFTPGQLRSAVRQSDRSARKRDTAKGQAPMQELADAASEVLPSSIGDSGTGGRNALLGLGVLGATGAGGGYLTTGDATGALAGAAALALPYSAAGRSGIQRVVVGERPAVVSAFGRALQERQRLLGAFGAGGFVSAFER